MHILTRTALQFIKRQATLSASPSSRIIACRAYSTPSNTAATMATPYKILIPASETGLWKPKQSEETAAKLSELLQDDLEKHHVFFNASGFHNHIVHQLLTLYGTGASSSALQSAYDANKSYQVNAMRARPNVIHDLQTSWSTHAAQYLGLGKHYPDFLAFFQQEMEQKGWQAVVAELLAEDTPKSRDFVQRLFSGIVHPLIQISYGLEWAQPAIIAEGLAQTAVHKNPLKKLFDTVDDEVNAADNRGEPRAKYRPLAEMYENVRSERLHLAGSARWTDEQRLYDGVLGRAFDDAVRLCVELRVGESDMEERTAEILHNNAYVAAAASWNPPHMPKYDFFLIHSLNSSAFFITWINLPFIPVHFKIRLIEHKLRYDILQYIARNCAPLSAASIKNYPIPSSDAPLKAKDLLPRFQDIADDGHLIKAVRSLLLAQEFSRKWKGRPWIRIDDDETWLKAQLMLLKGAEGQETQWVRSAGFKEAWEDVPKL